MATHLIIDGYNLLGVRAAFVGGADLEAARERLLRDLMAYRQRKGHTVTVVFDGWQQGLASERREHRAGVEVVFSRRGERADQVIQRLAQEFGRDCAVVSSDREVGDFARAQGAFVIGALEFQAKLEIPPAAAQAPGAFRKDSAEDELPRRNRDKKGNPRKLPKALRKRNRQIRGF
ncbi:MAG TPA: NYN domain-containing protein [Nitrospiraceae bacterium]|jgi:hypothetical protein|nr:NYN domain-containing protein [Nitrospiraceae bacterium]